MNQPAEDMDATKVSQTYGLKSFLNPLNNVSALSSPLFMSLSRLRSICSPCSVDINIEQVWDEQANILLISYK